MKHSRRRWTRIDQKPLKEDEKFWRNCAKIYGLYAGDREEASRLWVDRQLAKGSKTCPTCGGIHIIGTCPLLGMVEQPDGTYRR